MINGCVSFGFCQAIVTQTKMMTDEELVADLVEKVTRGEITFDKIRPLLTEKGLEEPRITQIVRTVDDEIQKSLLTKYTASSADQVIRIGIVLLVIGAALTIASLVGLISPSNNYMIVMAYGPLVGGLVLIIAGIRKKKKKNLGSGSDALKRTFRLRDKT